MVSEASVQHIGGSTLKLQQTLKIERMAPNGKIRGLVADIFAANSIATGARGGLARQSKGRAKCGKLAQKT